MSLFGGSGARSSQATTAPEVASAVRVQRSVNGAAVPVVYGTQRLPGNLIWYGDFAAQRRSQGGKSGGKGGATGGGGKGQTQPGSFIYRASFAVGLSAGTIQGIGRVWDTTGAPDTPPSLGGNVAIMTGAAGQAPWSYLAAKHPDQALGYSGLAYVGVGALSLGEAGALPNLNFEVIGLGPASACTAWSVPPSGHAWEPSFAAPSYTATPFAAIANVLGPPVTSANILFDTSPAFCIVDLLTSATYGAGLDMSLIGDPTAYATWCQANGLAFSAALTEQRDARSILRDWLDATLADAFWSNGQIKLATYADQPVTGTAADGKTPIAFTPSLAPAMSIDDSLMIAAASDAGPLAVTRKDPAEVYNRYTVEYADRDQNYNTVTVTADDAAHIDAYGLHPAPSLSADFVTSGAVASRIADMLLARATGVLATYEWRMKSPGELLEPFDVVTVTDTALGLVAYPVRVTEVEEEDDGVFRIAAEDIPGSMAAMASRPLAGNAGASSGANADPGSINAPILFEPPSALCISGSGLEVWALVSGTNTALWGGCDVWASTDGNSYAQVGSISGPARMGVLTAPLPAVTESVLGPTVDSADTLAVDLSQSDGELLGASAGGALALNTLCYADGELIAYQNAALAGGTANANTYNLTTLVRGAYDSAIGAHAAGSSFARLDGAELRYPFTPDRIGQTVYFKFLSFNINGGGGQTLDEVEPYTYVICGTALTEAPANVTTAGFFFNTAIGQSVLTWSGVADSRAIDYEVRFGASWNAAQILGRTPMTQIAFQGDGTYWIAAHFKVPNGPDIYSVAPLQVPVLGSQITANVAAAVTQASRGWPGAFANTAVVFGALTIQGMGDILSTPDVTALADVIYYGGVASSGSYHIAAADRVILSRVAMCNVVCTLGAILGYDPNAIDITKVADITQVQDMLGISIGPNVWAVPQISLSQDGLTWSAWQNWVPGAYSAMGFDARVLLFTNSPQLAPLLSDFVFIVDVPTITDSGTDVPVPAAGTSVSFHQTFNKGPGTGAVTPNVQVEITSGAQPGDQVLISGKSVTGFSIQIVNGGVGVSGRQIDWQASGW